VSFPPYSSMFAARRTHWKPWGKSGSKGW